MEEMPSELAVMFKNADIFTNPFDQKGNQDFEPTFLSPLNPLQPLLFEPIIMDPEITQNLTT
jgi:hypothetical protein